MNFHQERDYSGDMATQEVRVSAPPNSDIQPLFVPIPFSEITSARQGVGKLYIYGFVVYEIIGGDEKETRFCLEYHVPSGHDERERGWYIAVDVPLPYIQST